MRPRRHHDERQVGADETPMARELRHLVRTGPPEPLKDVTAAGLGALSAEDRGSVLRTIRARLVAGARLNPDDVVTGKAEGGFSV